MRYISTRGNHNAVSSAEAISAGMAPQGGLFVPERLPLISMTPGGSYQEMALQVLSPLLTDFSKEELEYCIGQAYNRSNFDIPSIIDLVKLGPSCSVMELWHGPTAAFKDMALQIMPFFMNYSKKKTENRSHTVILTATSGDTGKAALEGFKNREGISIIVFYPHEGVSEIQKLQMNTTDGDNTYVVAVKGNFDDCQTGVKNLFGDTELRSLLARDEFEFSSANSINWGRLCPQIAYYFRSYFLLVERGIVERGEPVNFCVPTGNFGNILAGYYAKLMGLPVNKLICASNKNRVLADFFKSGIYDRNREFFRTISPSMDILISSNLERFLFEITGHDAGRINSFYGMLGRSGAFSVDKETIAAVADIVVPGWVDEERVLETIKTVYDKYGYILDTHTAVGIAVCREAAADQHHTVIASTASPYKFAGDVLRGIESHAPTDEFEAINRLASLSKTKVHRAVDGLGEKPVRHKLVIEKNDMKQTVIDIVHSIRK